jgi:hypothetical protein
MKQLFERIIAWGMDKGLHDIEFNALVQIGFLLKELAEVNDEFIAGNTDKAVGEICDLIVFSVNALVLLKHGVLALDFKFRVETYTFAAKDIDVIKNLTMSIYSVMSNIKCELLLSVAYSNLINNCCRSINALGYSPKLALEQTVLKIESRQGAFDESIGKWVKTATLYEPDYSLARLK